MAKGRKQAAAARAGAMSTDNAAWNSSSQDGLVKTVSSVDAVTDASTPAEESRSEVCNRAEEKHEADDGTNGKQKNKNKRGREENEGEDGNDTKPLSKSAQKKLKKMERLALKKQETKARLKKEKKENREKKAQNWESLSDAQKEAAIQRSKEARKIRVEQSNAKKEKRKQAFEAGLNLVIDFEFCQHMQQNEINSMGQQVMFSYAANLKAPVPMRLSLTGLSGAMKEQLERVPGYSNWYLHREEKPYLEVFESRKADLVYLTADSSNVLDSIDESKIYIIGGLVDHNRLKGITFEKAKQQEIATARLPIQEHMKLAASTVLTVNQVVQILLDYLECKDWPKAMLKVIPQRKIAT